MLLMRKSEPTTHKETEDRFATFVYAVFLAVVLFTGTVIWNLVGSNAALDKRIAVLEIKCLPATVPRGT
jgi:hypothetical protein